MKNWFRKLFGLKPVYRVKAWNVAHEVYRDIFLPIYPQNIYDSFKRMNVSDFEQLRKDWNYREARGLN